jgi:hypothetical protein
MRTALILLFLAACGRPLTETERAFAFCTHGDTLDYSAVRQHDGAPASQ